MLMKILSTIKFYWSLPKRYLQLVQCIGHLQPVGKIREIQDIFEIKYRPRL